MITALPTKLLTPNNFDECPLWKYDDDSEYNYPVLDASQIPESERDLFTIAKFTTQYGDVLLGCVIGISYVFSVGLFGGDKIFIFNKNLPDRARQHAKNLVALHPSLRAKTVEELFPLKYQTAIGRPGYREFSGLFEMDR
jgi:hypothetical protein